MDKSVALRRVSYPAFFVNEDILMTFIVTPEIFEKLPNLYVGVVVAKEVDNSQDYSKINELLNKYMNFSQEKFDGVNVKQNE